MSRVPSSLAHARVHALALAALTLTLTLLAPVPSGAASPAQLPSGIPPLPPAYTTWPKTPSPIPLDAAMEARIKEIVAGMTVEQKVGQITQPDAFTITPEQIRKYYIGTVLVGGEGWPGNDRKAPGSAWLAVADQLWQASMSTDAKVKIPLLWGIDAVHGQGRVYGTTIFPHNIGLGATHDPGLVRRVGAATAQQLRATGQDWNFAPCVAVPRDDRWGRTYEGFSEDPAITRILGQEYVAGFQNLGPKPDARRPYGGVATAKHFLGDGGTELGLDQGVNLSPELQLVNLFGQGYYGAQAAGVQSIMVSFNGWMDAPKAKPRRNELAEAKIHGSKYLVTDVLKGKMGFDGIVVGDWKGHAQVPGCTNARCARAINAGIDVFMVADEWRPFFESTVDLVKTGEVPMARLDDAVTRILRVKMRMGLFDMPKPSERPGAKDAAKLVHHELAAEAVQKSLVLLKNDGKVLPLDRKAKVLVVGKSADSLMNQTGGWTIDWAGRSNPNDMFPAGSTILSGIRAAVGDANVTFSEKGDADVSRFDAVIAVIGETPYVEFTGDVMPGLNERAPETLEHAYVYKEDLQVLKKVSGKGKPVVTIYLSGRPLLTNKEINRSDAFVAAWLPGTEGAAIAPVLFKGPDGKPARDFTGKLSFSWPKEDCKPVNVGDASYDPAFPFGYGLTYADAKRVAPLPEAEFGVCE